MLCQLNHQIFQVRELFERHKTIDLDLPFSIHECSRPSLPLFEYLPRVQRRLYSTTAKVSFSTSSFIFHCTMNRTPLSSISGNHRRHHQYTLYQKGLICEAIDGGLTSSRIEKQYRVSESSVRYVLSTHKSQSTRVSNPRSGRPKVLTTREQRHIIRIARRDPKITYKNFKIQAEVDCSTDTIYRLLKEEDIIN